MITLISAIIGGLIIGALARMVMPGHQNISIVMTILLGMAGSAIGTWIVTTVFHYKNANGGFAIIPFLAGIGTAAVLISIYMSLTGRRSVGS